MILTEPRTLQRGYFEPSAIRKLIDNHLKRGRAESHYLWRLLIFELWHRNFLEKYVSPAGLSSLAGGSGVLDRGSIAPVLSASSRGE